MYITQLPHYLDDEGNIVKNMPKPAREIASFQALIVDIATRDYHPPIKATDLRCFNKKCTGTIELAIIEEDEGEPIEWWCTHCEHAGRISKWQGTKFDNR